PESGKLLRRSSARGAEFRGVRCRTRVKAKGACRLRELNRTARGIGLRSGYLESIESQGQGLALLGALRMQRAIWQQPFLGIRHPGLA
ncbi:MAG: hypothetical protein ACREYC_23595, partial [Gammaproteobacteria bacterium]